MSDFERLGAFYLGHRHGAADDGRELVLYDSKDLTTHAVCVGMTGSGKTGLCIDLLEEAALDGVPAICIDPKGDLGNLLLTFPDLEPSDFRPWVDEAQALRHGRTLDQEAASVAKLWREGLAASGQDGDRIQRLRDAVDVALYTPGSSAGLSLSALRSFDAPPAVVRDDADALRERVMAATASVLALVGVAGDPLVSREHVLLATLLESTWRAGRPVDLAGLVRAVQSPPFETIGVFDLESFYPARHRMELALRLNNLLASPGFAAWREGEALDVGRLLHAPDGRPRISILSIAHLSDAERMFFVTLLLSEVVAWMRAQPGTSSLRAILFMDEVYGYLPPVAEPPSKRPLLTLLKQARAHGLGCVLATQNPADLDYKALSNAGTWMVGRLQAERDVERVLDGLEAASRSSGRSLERSELAMTLSGLPKRVFLLHDVHEEEPVLFHTRWAMSYLRGPLTRPQIERLTAERKAAAASARSELVAAEPPATPVPLATAALRPAAEPTPPLERPAPPPGLSEAFLPSAVRIAAPDRLVRRPRLLAVGRVHHARASLNLDLWRDVAFLAPLPTGRARAVAWDEAQRLETLPELSADPEPGGAWEDVPAPARRAKAVEEWEAAMEKWLYRNERLVVLKSREHRLRSEPGEGEGAFRARVVQAAREARDLDLEKLREKHAPKLARLQQRLARANERLETQQEQHGHQRLSTAVSIGATVLGALFGRKALSVGTVRRAGSTVRRASRASKEKTDIAQAEARVAEVRAQLADLEASFEKDLDALRRPVDAADLELQRIEVPPRKSDVEVVRLVLLWTPWRVSPAGIAEPAW